jgi:hypothetical protein
VFLVVWQVHRTIAVHFSLNLVRSWANLQIFNMVCPSFLLLAGYVWA